MTSKSPAIFQKPLKKPARPYFSSGPCAKRPDYDVANLDLSVLGRSHRSAIGKDMLGKICLETKQILGLPDDWRVGIVPASDTGAMEMALWSLLGERGVDVLGWETFGLTWVNDITRQLNLDDVRVFDAPYGKLPDLNAANFQRDIVFTWNGTTSGVCVPDGNWIDSNRAGLVICDATSAAFSMKMPWDKLDVVTFSWQKALGGEGAHGVLMLSPRAVLRLESYCPPWPMPKIFRLTSGGKLIEGIFKGDTINTPSMLCAADCLDALNWVRDMGGQDALIAQSQKSLSYIKEFVAKNHWIDFLAEDEKTISPTSVCLKLDLEPEKVKEIAVLLENEGVAFDINSYKDAPSGLRIWCGATVSPQDVQDLLPWIKWAYKQVN